MAQSKSTRAFRTISEAADELELRAHVLRFWESKFSDIQPMKRRGGRRFYRPEDIEFLRGIKILLHREKHPIKDVQKLIRIRGAQSVMELGRSAEIASRPRDIKDTTLVPERIKPVIDKAVVVTSAPQTPPVQQGVQANPVDDGIVRRPGVVDLPDRRHVQKGRMVQETQSPAPAPSPVQKQQSPGLNSADKANLEDVLLRLKSLRSRWQKFK